MRLTTRNWREYQHYKNRCPPWIKLHFRILTSRAWVGASDTERVLAIACMLIASQDDANDGSFEADPEFVQRVAYLSTKPDFNPLIRRRFLEESSECKQMLANATTETETEEEKEEEKEKPSAHAQRNTNGCRLPEDFIPLPEHYALAIQLGLNCDMEYQRFRDYWLGATGSRARKCDWSATLRNWLRTAAERNPNATRPTGQRIGTQVSKAEQRKLDNLEVNARVKQRIRERLEAGN